MHNVLLGLKQLEKESFKYREEEKTGKTRNHKGPYTKREKERLGQSVLSSSLSVLSMLEMAMALSIQTDGIHIA